MDESPEPQQAADPTTARAEELVDEVAQRASSWFSRISLEVVKGVARAREEAEDIWAEAQSMQRRGQP